MKTCLFIALCISPLFAVAQSPEYQIQKEQKLSTKSPFEKIVDRELPANIVYEDDEIIAFQPLGNQAPVHFLIVPKKRIPTLNDVQEEDALLIGKMVLVAQKVAKEQGVAETGYRLVFNTNEDSGQSVFHIHLHLLGGHQLGPIVDQTWRNTQEGKKD